MYLSDLALSGKKLSEDEPGVRENHAGKSGSKISEGLGIEANLRSVDHQCNGGRHFVVDVIDKRIRNDLLSGDTNDRAVTLPKSMGNNDLVGTVLGLISPGTVPRVDPRRGISTLLIEISMGSAKAMTRYSLVDFLNQVVLVEGASL
jgi:hypothetical protein